MSCSMLRSEDIGCEPIVRVGGDVGGGADADRLRLALHPKAKVAKACEQPGYEGC